MRNLIVEFVGAPGVGKTTASHALAEDLRREGGIVSEPTYEFARRPGSMGLLQLRRSLRLLGREPLQAFRCVRIGSGSRQPTLRRAVTRALDRLYGCELMLDCADRAGVHIFDQGVLQSIASTLYSSRRSPNAAALQNAAHSIYESVPRVATVFVRAAPEIVAQRLEQRVGMQSESERLGSANERRESVAKFAAAVDRVEGLAKELEGRIDGRFRVLSFANDRADGSDALAAEIQSRLCELEFLP